MMKIRFLPLLCCLLSTPTWADIYKHVDENGNVTFTNTPMKGAQVILVESANPPPAVPKARSNNPTKAQAIAPSPAAFPRVDTGSQKERDVNRRRILEEELAAEQRLLADRKKELADADHNRSAEEKTNPQKYLARLSRLRENMLLHEKNIAALQTEISKIR